MSAVDSPEYKVQKSIRDRGIRWTEASAGLAEPVETESDIMPAKLVFDYLPCNIFLRECFLLRIGSILDAFMLRALLLGAGESALVLAGAWKYPR